MQAQAASGHAKGARHPGRRQAHDAVALVERLGG
jgi:hypothetical protein